MVTFKQPSTHLVICSGGLDSVTLAYIAHEARALGALASFNYGQRHAKELIYAARAAADLGVQHYVVDLTSYGLAINGSGSSLIDENSAVPDGHYAAETMRATIVPNRNMVMLAMAAGIASAHGYGSVAYAAHGGDHFIYPDCRPEFIMALAKAIRLGTLDESKETPRGVELVAPFARWTKADIVSAGNGIGVDFTGTWSCYKGGDVHCGACGTCFERREAFITAGLPDPTTYAATPDYAAPQP
jgi:7-cyano-7-deazaguanine synthase